MAKDRTKQSAIEPREEEEAAPSLTGLDAIVEVSNVTAMLSSMGDRYKSLKEQIDNTKSKSLRDALYKELDALTFNRKALESKLTLMSERLEKVKVSFQGQNLTLVKAVEIVVNLKAQATKFREFVKNYRAVSFGFQKLETLNRAVAEAVKDSIKEQDSMITSLILSFGSIEILEDTGEFRVLWRKDQRSAEITLTWNANEGVWAPPPSVEISHRGLKTYIDQVSKQTQEQVIPHGTTAQVRVSTDPRGHHVFSTTVNYGGWGYTSTNSGTST